MKTFHIDAFTNNVFGGNPACVIPLNKWLPDSKLLAVSKENGVSETAFFVNKGENIELRWFTPDSEIDLCGHATLAAAYVLKTKLGYYKDEIVFETISGIVKVTENMGLYTLDFPSRPPIDSELPDFIEKSLNILPDKVLKSRDYILIYDNEDIIRNISINRAFFDKANIYPGGVAVTSIGNSCDFVSRFFTPQASILEDPVTGSAHCSLIPYWSKRLNKKKMAARQLSSRGGELYCEDCGERVFISGRAVTYSEGKILI